MSFSYIPIENPKLPYRLKDFPVFFKELSCLDAIHAVLDEKGNILNFPGITKDWRWERKHHIGQCYDVRFEAQFYSIENDEVLMLWLIQPSGWDSIDDDGFGFSGDSSIMMYSVLDGNGRFLKPFELFSIDEKRYCHEFDRYLK